MIIIDIKIAQQILQKKVTFGHAKRHSKKIRIVCYTYLLNKNVFFFTLTYYGNTDRIN